jgi:uncharacterized GH25 family protein
MMAKYLLALCLLFSSLGIFAHALWIETNPVGKKGQAQEVNIFYGEYSEGKPEKIEDWWSDVKEFSIWLIGPDNQKTQLTVSPVGDHFTTSFTPSGDGSYTLLISHDVKEIGEKTKYQFNTSANVRVGAITSSTTAINPFSAKIQGSKLKKPVRISGVFNDQPADKFTATIFSPSGWTKEISSENGVVEFIPEWSGKYMIEISKTDEEKGNHAGKAFDKVWRCATTLVNIQ